MAIILISGGTGLIGRAFTKQLLTAGHEVRILTRHKKPSNSNLHYFEWDINNGTIDESAIENIDHVIHLAGEGIADKRWTKKRKEEIITSRVNSFHLIESVIKKKNIRLKSVVGTSAIGFYGMQTSTKIFSETDNPGSDFLSDVCVKWEDAYASVSNYSDKKTVIRVGIVLAKNGGALQKMLPIFNFGLGSATGNGSQFMPWIHIDDLIAIFIEALFNPNVQGEYNAVSGESITNQQFSKALANTLHKPFFMPAIPAFILKIIFGELSQLLLTGSRISNQKIVSTGFKFKYTSIQQALHNILKE